MLVGNVSASATFPLSERFSSNNVARLGTPTPTRDAMLAADFLAVRCQCAQQDVVTVLSRWTEPSRDDRAVNVVRRLLRVKRAGNRIAAALQQDSTSQVTTEAVRFDRPQSTAAEIETATKDPHRIPEKRLIPKEYFRQAAVREVLRKPDAVRGVALNQWSVRRDYTLADGLEALGRICMSGKETATFLVQLYELSLDVRLTPGEKETVLLVGSIVDAISSVVPQVGIMKIVGVSSRITAKTLRKEPLTKEDLLDIAIVAKNYKIRHSGDLVRHKAATIVGSDIGLTVGRYAWKRAHVDLSQTYLNEQAIAREADAVVDESAETASTLFYVMVGDIPLIQTLADARSNRWRLLPLERYEATYRPEFLSWPIYTLPPFPVQFERSTWFHGSQMIAKRGPLYRDDGADDEQFYINIDDSWYAVRHGLSSPSYVFNPTDSALPGLPVENAGGVWRFKPLCYTPVTHVSGAAVKDGVIKAKGKRYILLMGDIVEVTSGGLLDDQQGIETAPIVASASWLCPAQPRATIDSPVVQEASRDGVLSRANSVTEAATTRMAASTTVEPLPVQRPTKKRRRVPKLPHWGLG